MRSRIRFVGRALGLLVKVGQKDYARRTPSQGRPHAADLQKAQVPGVGSWLRSPACRPQGGSH